MISFTLTSTVRCSLCSTTFLFTCCFNLGGILLICVHHLYIIPNLFNLFIPFFFLLTYCLYCYNKVLLSYLLFLTVFFMYCLSNTSPDLWSLPVLEWWLITFTTCTTLIHTYSVLIRDLISGTILTYFSATSDFRHSTSPGILFMFTFISNN